MNFFKGNAMSNVSETKDIEDGVIVEETQKEKFLYFFSFSGTKGDNMGFGSHIFNIEDGKINALVLQGVCEEIMKKMELSTCTILNWNKIEE